MIIEWISANFGTVFVCAVIVAATVALIISRIRDKKKGNSCCGSCSDCAMSGKCHSNVENKEDKPE